ncbi:MAG: hypothetical protein WCN95_04070 [bacterium]
MKLKWNELPAIFLAAFATLLYEVTATKIFEFSLWANYAYMVISTVMFGLGLSGVILTRWPRLLTSRETIFLPATTILTAISMITGFIAMNYVPIHLVYAPNGWPREVFSIAVVFFSLGLPFVFFGLMISFLFDRRARLANVYYFADLLGAGLGAFALVPLIPIYQPQGLVVVCSLLTLGAAIFFILGSIKRPAVAAVMVILTVVATITAIVNIAPGVAERVPLRVHLKKRSYNLDVADGNRLEKWGWSALSRVDIASYDNTRKRVWIAGGINESAIIKFDGNFDKLRAKRPEVLKAAAEILDYHAIPHLLKTNHTVCVIGTSGGEDSIYTIMMGAKKVVGIEMDPMIAKFVTVDYKAYAGGLFTDGTNSELIIDEGRSYLRRANRKFDVIQVVNNFTPIAFQNGALNLSETSLFTVESFGEFYNSLNADGILGVSRYGSAKLLATAVAMFRAKGMKPEEYSKHLFVCDGPGPLWIMNTFLMKKSPFTPEEVDKMFEFFAAGKHGRKILYAPYRSQDLPKLESNLYYQLATSDDPSKFWRVGCFNFTPPTDDRPFFNRFKVLGERDLNRNPEQLPLLPTETRLTEGYNVLDRRVPSGDLPPVIILMEALLLSLIFFGLPLLSKKELRQTLRKQSRALGYFACLGVAFIAIEVCMIQRLVLFLGAPVYSIATVLGGMLVAAGLGSLASGLFKASFTNVRRLLICVALVVLLLHFSIPLAEKYFLGSRLLVRVCIALGITGGAGFIMGMPMPTGIRFLKESGAGIIPWAWAANGFFSVVGSALSVMIASTLGFPVVFYSATILYALAPLFLAGRTAATSSDTQQA